MNQPVSKSNASTPKPGSLSRVHRIKQHAAHINASIKRLIESDQPTLETIFQAISLFLARSSTQGFHQKLENSLTSQLFKYIRINSKTVYYHPFYLLSSS